MTTAEAKDTLMKERPSLDILWNVGKLLLAACGVIAPLLMTYNQMQLQNAFDSRYVQQGQLVLVVDEKFVSDSELTEALRYLEKDLHNHIDSDAHMSEADKRRYLVFQKEFIAYKQEIDRRFEERAALGAEREAKNAAVLGRMESMLQAVYRKAMIGN